MKNKIIETILKAVLGAWLNSLSSEKVKEVADKALDVIEDYVAKTPTDMDDVLVLPLVKIIRDTFGIEDNDD